MRPLLFALLFAFTVPAFAMEDAKNPPDEECREGWRHSQFSVAIGPAWVHVLQDNYTPAFVNNGFKTPGKDRIGLDFLAYWSTESHWQIGLGVDSFSFEQDNGSWSADYSNSVIGVYAAKNFSGSTDYDITVGALLGINNAEVTVLSNNQNGRLQENAAVIAPSVGYATRVGRFIKLGLRGSYFVPFGESTQLNGQNLGIEKIGARGFLLAFQVILGR